MPVVEVLELLLGDKVGYGISVIDVDASEVLEVVEEKGKVDVQKQFEHNICYAMEVMMIF